MHGTYLFTLKHDHNGKVVYVAADDRDEVWSKLKAFLRINDELGLGDDIGPWTMHEVTLAGDHGVYVPKASIS
jgi:hypothetical protein